MSRPFWEPWTAAKSRLHGGPPDTAGMPADAAAGLLDAWGRSDRDADWVLWGSGMYPPQVVRPLAGGPPSVSDDRGIVLQVRRRLGRLPGEPTHRQVAERIAACVNALVNVPDPVVFLATVAFVIRGLSEGDPVSPEMVGTILDAIELPPTGDEWANFCGC